MFHQKLGFNYGSNKKQLDGQMGESVNGNVHV